MKMLKLLMLSLFVFIPLNLKAGLGGLENEESEFSPSLFCSEIQKNLANNLPIDKICGGFKFHAHETAIVATCESFIADYQNNPELTTQRCEELGVNLQEAINNTEHGETLDLRYYHNKQVSRGTLKKDNDADYTDLVSTTMKSCNEAAEADCTAPFVEINILELVRNFPKGDIFTVSTVPVNYDSRTCGCFTKMRKESATLYNRDIKKEDEDGKKKIEDLIEKNISQKLINEFAANLESAHFYTANEATSLSAASKDQAFACTDVEEYKKEIQKSCKGSGLTEKEINSKISNYLDAFEDQTSSLPIKDKLKILQEKILNTGESKDGRLMDRKQYDQYRYSNAVEGPEGKFIQELIQMILADRNLSENFDQELELKSPAWALSNVLDRYNTPKIQEFFQGFTNRLDIPHDFKKDIAYALSDKNNLDDFKARVFEIAIDMNPSLKASLSDKDLFKKVVKNWDAKDSLVGALEKSSDMLKEHYVQKCNGFKKKFSEAICTPKKDFLKKMNRTDLKKLLTANSENFSAHMIDKLMCEVENETSEKGSVFGRVAFTRYDKFVESDYSSRMNAKKGSSNATDRYSYLSKEMSRGNKSVVEMVERTSHGPRSAPSGPSIASFQDKESTKSVTSTSPAQITPEKTLSPPQIYPQNFAFQQSAARAPANESDESRNKGRSNNSETNLHDLFKSFFAEESQKRKVDDHLKNINDSDYKELQRIREQIAKGKVELNQLASQQELEKIKSLEDKIKRLENEKKSAENRSEMNTTRRETGNSDKIAGSAPQFQAGGFIPNKDATPTFSSAPTTAGSSGAMGGGSVQSQGGAGTSAAVRGPGSDGKTIESGYSIREASGGDLIITSSKVHSNNLRTEDLSAEVIDFVKNQKPDLKTLKRLMSNGLILKLKVIKDGQETHKEFKVDSTKLTDQARNYLKNQIALQEYHETKRQHSFTSLKYLLGIKLQSTVN